MATLSNDNSYVTVVSGDTLSQIALDYSAYSGGKTYKQLAQLNNIPNPDLIYVGQKILLKSSGGSGSGSSSTDAQKVTINQFGIQSDTDNVLFITWSWSKSNTEEYEVRWDYFTNNYWFGGTSSTSTTKDKFSTYTIPSNAKQVRVRIRPISQKKKEGNKEVSYWSASWSDWKKHSVSNPPAKPGNFSVEITGLTLTAEVANLQDDPSLVQFEVVKDNVTVCKTGKSSVTTATASYSCTVAAGSKYKVRCRAYKDGLYSDWTDYSQNYNTPPATPTAFTTCEAKSDTSIKLVWPSIGNAVKYEVQKVTDKTHFDVPDKPETKTTETNELLWVDLEIGKEYFFRVRAINESDQKSGWSETSSAVIGKPPAAPTTWSSTTTVMVGEPLNLYWVHNSEDGSNERLAHLEVYVDNVRVINTDITKNQEDANKGITSSYTIDTSQYSEGAEIRWFVETAGLAERLSERSIERVVNVYARPSLELTVTKSDGKTFEALDSFPINISALAHPTTQTPISYYLTVTSNSIYETVDSVGNSKTVNEGEIIYSKHFDSSNPFPIELSAGDLSLENGYSYTITCTVSMNSGLTADDSKEFEVAWAKSEYLPNAEIGIDEDTYSAYIKPYCATYKLIYHKVTKYDTTPPRYVKTAEELSSVWGMVDEKVRTSTGENVYSGMIVINDVETEVYYCVKEESIPIEDVMLSVYRREFDGSFTELATKLDGSKNTFITDPHPSLDYARYRIVAKSSKTGAINYCDIPGYPVDCKAAIIQWDEAWSEFDTFGNEDALEQPAWSGSLLKLPYNIDVSNKHSSDVELVEYVGRKHPVTYYGTQLGETATWNMVIEKSDKETLYALRRLSVWTGDVYVREPSGSGYWANVNVSFSQKHMELTIPVTLEITRVEGGA